MALASTSALPRLRTLASISRSVLSSTSFPLASSSSSSASSRSSARTFAAAAAYSEPEEHYHPASPSPSSSHSHDSGPYSDFRAVRNTTTASEASAYLSDLLRLPAGRKFPPALALQILTHKSYRFAHHLRTSSPSSSSPSPTSPLSTTQQGLASHNARLSFLGRRAIASYLALFVHSALARNPPGSQGGAVSLKDRIPSFLGGRDLEGKLDALMHVNNLGRQVGEAWGVGDVMLWDHAETSREGGHVKVKGLTVESIIGGTFTHLGSPAAHAAFHMHVLPHLARQMREPALIEAVERMKDDAEKGYGGGVVRP